MDYFLANGRKYLLVKFLAAPVSSGINMVNKVFDVTPIEILTQ